VPRRPDSYGHNWNQGPPLNWLLLIMLVLGFLLALAVLLVTRDAEKAGGFALGVLFALIVAKLYLED
jgi:hypothetical protein